MGAPVITRNPLEQLILDFYAVAALDTPYIHPDDAGFIPAKSDSDVAFNIVENRDIADVKKRVITSIKELFIRDVRFSLCAEVRHMYDYAIIDAPVLVFFKKHFGSIGEKWAEIYDMTYLFEGNKAFPYALPRIDKTFSNCYPGYIRSYAAVMVAEAETGLMLHEVCLKLFDSNLVKWSDYFGGQKWFDITRAYITLLEAEDHSEIIKSVDVLAAIEHNTATVFNKLESWMFNGRFEWLSVVLDIKFQSKTPYSFMAMCSPDVQRIYNRYRRTELMLQDRPRYREDFSGEKKANDFLPSKEVETRIVIRKLGNGEAVILMHEGAEKTFLVHAVYWGESKNGSFSTYVVRACGWKVAKAYNRYMTFFAFSENELLGVYVKKADVEMLKKSHTKFHWAVLKIYKRLNTLVQESKLRVKVGDCIVNPQGGEARFRIYKAVERKDGEGKRLDNVRFYFLLEEYSRIDVLFSTTPTAMQDPKEDAPKIASLYLDDSLDKAVEAMILTVNAIIMDSDGLLQNPKMLRKLVKHIEEKDSEQG